MVNHNHRIVDPLVEVLTVLTKHQARYVVVGGVAAVMHGRIRMTADLDLVISMDAGNVNRTLDALDQIGFVPRLPVDPKDLADPLKREDWIQNRNLVAFSMVNPTNPLLVVDLLLVTPVPFDALQKGAVPMRLATMEVPVCSIAHLIHMKKYAGRPEDLSDIEELRKL